MKEGQRNEEIRLLALAQQGDQRAFQQLIIYLQASVASTAMSMLGNFHEAEDIAQDVFIKLHQNIAEFKGDSSIKTYVVRITINLCLNLIKKKSRRKWLSLSNWKDESNQALAVDSEENQFETKEAVNKALQKLDPNFRSVVSLRLIEGYSVKETAEILEIPQGTVLSRLARAQKKLKHDLEVLWK